MPRSQVYDLMNFYSIYLSSISIPMYQPNHHFNQDTEPIQHPESFLMPFPDHPQEPRIPIILTLDFTLNFYKRNFRVCIFLVWSLLFDMLFLSFVRQVGIHQQFIASYIYVHNGYWLYNCILLRYLYQCWYQGYVGLIKWVRARSPFLFYSLKEFV